MNLTHTRLIARDLATMVHFYRELTGVSPVARNPNYVEFLFPGVTLALSTQGVMDLHGAGSTTPASNRSAILDIRVDDVDCERVRIAGLVREFVLEPTNQPWGNRSMLFRDPDGNLINFYAPITQP